MQDLIALDAGDVPVRPAVLYSDARAGAEAEEALKRLGTAEVRRVTRNPFNAGSRLLKMLHLQAHEPAAWARTARVLMGVRTTSSCASPDAA